LLLLYLCKTICVTPKLWTIFDWARLIQKAPPRFAHIAVDGKGADTDESPHAIVQVGCFEKIARCDNRIHKCVSKISLSRSRGQMKDNGRALCRAATILARQQIARDHVDVCVLVVVSKRFDFSHVAGRPNETPQVAKAAIEQATDEFGADETRRASYQDKIVLPEYERAVFRLSHISLLLRNVRLFDRVDADECEDPANVAKKFDQATHPCVMPQN